MMKQRSWIQQRLAKRQARQLWRVRRPITARRLPELTTAEHSSLISFCSNDYLGLTQHPQVIAAAQKYLTAFGVGSAGSALVGGYTQVHAELEQAMAAWLKVERALVFPSGYLANLALASGLLSGGKHVWADKLCHASLMDALQMMSATFKRYPHLDMVALQRLIAKSSIDDPAFMITDGVFSVSGAIAPLDRLQILAEQTGATLIVDDTHGVGVVGVHGLGSWEHCQLDAPPVLTTFSLAKAFGCSGAIIAGQADYVEHLLQFARPYMFTSAMAPLLAGAALASLQVLQQESWRRQRLVELIQFFCQQAAARSLCFLPSSTPIQTLVESNVERAIRLADYLRQRGFWVSLLRPPAVEPHRACLRFTLTCLHDEQQIRDVLDQVLAFQSEDCIADVVA